MKKGFTLIEILGVIIILSVLSTVAVVGVDKSIKKGRVATCEAQEENIMEAAKMYLTDNPKANTRMITIGQLRNGGYLDKDFVNPMTGEKYKDDTYVNKGKNTVVYQNEPSCTGEESVTTEPIIWTWNNRTSSDFHGYSYRSNITSVIFEDKINIPDDAVKSWDVSNERGSKTVMAWVMTDPENTTKYILHIAGDGGVIANPNSAYLFYDFSSLKSIDFGNNFDTGMVTNMSSMFEGCRELSNLNLSNFDTSMVTNMSKMFYNCQNITSLDLSNFVTSNVVDMSHMFDRNVGLNSLNIRSFNTKNVTNMESMFESCHKLKEIDISRFNTSKVTNMKGMFYNCYALTSLDVSKFNTSRVTDMSYMFAGCSSLGGIDVTKFTTSKVTDMSYMFARCENFNTLDVTKFDTSNVKSMEGMFGEIELESIDLSNFNTSKVENMSHMFSGFSHWSGTKILDVSSFDTSNVTDMSWMFSGCRNILELDLSNFNTSNVTNMESMFSSDTSVLNHSIVGATSRYLKKVVLTSFDTSNVTNMKRMFYCGGTPCSLESLDLSSFDTSKVTDMSQMFRSNSSLYTIYVSNKFKTDSVTSSDSMFTNDFDLKGSEGTSYSHSNANDRTYAHVDGGSSNPGYFTLKS